MRNLGWLRYTWRTRSVAASAAVIALGPAFVVAVGKDSDAPIRLRLVGLLLAALLALIWEDRTAPLAAATPVGLPALQRGRFAVGLLAASAAWALTCWATATQVPQVGAWSATVEFAAVAALVTAAVGTLARERPGESLAGYPVPLLIVLLLLAFRVPHRWALVASPGSPDWADAHRRWAVLLFVGLVGIAFSTRDPAAARIRRRR